MKQKMLQAVFLVVILVGPTWAIGPYFENESNQGQGPRAEIPKPLARVPDSRIATTFVKGEIRRAEEGLYIVKDSTGKEVPIYIGKAWLTTACFCFASEQTQTSQFSSPNLVP